MNGFIHRVVRGLAPRTGIGMLAALFVLVQLFAVPALPALARAEPADLVKIQVRNEAALNQLAAHNLAIFAKMGAVDGSWVITARADDAQQAALAAAGFNFTVVENNVPADAADFYLLYGLPEDLETLQKEQPQGVALLVVVDRQALARLTPAQLAEVDARGIYTLPVVPSALPEKPAQAAAAQSLAPDLAYSPAVQRMINDLTQATLVEYLSKLTGEVPATIDGAPYTLSTRYTHNYQAITKATRFGYEHFRGLGLPADYDYYYMNGLERRNVIAEQPGMTTPSRLFMLTAHLDSRAADYDQSMNLAPGADDNGSGSAALMAISEILSNHRFACTLRYALFTGEEQGLYGSTDYAADVDNRGDNLLGVLNLDMLGYSTAGSSPTIELHTRPGNGGDLNIAYQFRDAVTTYSLPLTPLIRQDSLSFSDHSPFWDRGFPALLAIEDWSDHTPHYHRTSDQIETLNLPYYTAFARAALATFANMGCLLDDGLGGRVTQEANGLPLPGAQVTATKAFQRPAVTAANIRGDYYLDLTDGAYTVKVSAPGYRSETYTNVQVVSGEAAARNSALEPCSTLSGLTVNVSNGRPETGQPVTFNATVASGAQPATYSWSFGDEDTASGAQVSHTFSSPGMYLARVTANNTCDYPLTATLYLLVDAEGTFLPITAR